MFVGKWEWGMLVLLTRRGGFAKPEEDARLEDLSRAGSSGGVIDTEKWKCTN